MSHLEDLPISGRLYTSAFVPGRGPFAPLSDDDPDYVHDLESVTVHMTEGRNICAMNPAEFEVLVLEILEKELKTV